MVNAWIGPDFHNWVLQVHYYSGLHVREFYLKYGFLYSQLSALADYLYWDTYTEIAEDKGNISIQFLSQ